MPLDNKTPEVRNNPMPTPRDEKVFEAHEQADKDIEQDGEFSLKREPIDDLDEGESAAFEDEAAAKDDNEG